jgi:hypothetical protein
VPIELCGFGFDETVWCEMKTLIVNSKAYGRKEILFFYLTKGG